MVTTKFVYDGKNVFIFDFDEGQARDKLAPAIYTAKLSQMGYYLEHDKDKFAISEKTYGSLSKRANRIIKTYEDRSSSTGVLLTGLKGAGKTLLSQKVSNILIDKGMPVILIEQPFHDSHFISFLNKIGECVLIFDEFARVFEIKRTTEGDKDPQNNLLGVFDGNKSCKRLIFVIDNNFHKMNEYYVNRPGRLFYHFEYNRLEEIVIDEYCEDLKVDKLIQKQIKAAYYRIRLFSFDILKAIVDEHLRFPDDSISEIVESLNIDADSFYKTYLQISNLVHKDTRDEFLMIAGNSEIEYNERCHGQIVFVPKGTDPNNTPKEELKKIMKTSSFDFSDIIFENDKKVAFSDREYIIEFNKVTKSTFGSNYNNL